MVSLWICVILASNFSGETLFKARFVYPKIIKIPKYGRKMSLSACKFYPTFLDPTDSRQMKNTCLYYLWIQEYILTDNVAVSPLNSINYCYNYIYCTFRGKNEFDIHKLLPYKIIAFCWLTEVNLGGYLQKAMNSYSGHSHQRGIKAHF